MSRLSLGTTILLLSAAWTLAQAGAPRTDENPTGSTQSAEQPGTSQTASIEGCLSGVVDDFVLTTAKGRTYELTGDIAQLTARVGNTVRVWGHADSVTDAELMVAGGPHTAFGVEKISSLSAACK
ncbi:MAG TPA: hypothetical protein VI488_07390 [Candidatus Angelobacter sp.]